MSTLPCQEILPETCSDSLGTRNRSFEIYINSCLTGYQICYSRPLLQWFLSCKSSILSSTNCCIWIIMSCPSLAPELHFIHTVKHLLLYTNHVMSWHIPHCTSSILSTTSCCIRIIMSCHLMSCHDISLTSPWAALHPYCQPMVAEYESSCHVMSSDFISWHIPH